MKKLSRRNFFKGAVALAAMPLMATQEKTRKKQTNRLKVVHITDAHMDLGNPETVEALKMAVKYLNKNYPDLDCVLMGGDNFNNNMKADSDALVYKKIMEKLHCPVYHVRGNKESNPANDQQIDLEAFKKLFMSYKELTVSGKDWAVEKNGTLILGLDSCIEHANNGEFSKETIEALFDYPNLLATLSGHKHIDNIKLINKVKTITTRGFIRPLDLDEYPMRYVEINGNDVSEKLIYTIEG